LFQNRAVEVPIVFVNLVQSGRTAVHSGGTTRNPSRAAATLARVLPQPADSAWRKCRLIRSLESCPPVTGWQEREHKKCAGPADRSSCPSELTSQRVTAQAIRRHVVDSVSGTWQRGLRPQAMRWPRARPTVRVKSAVAMKFLSTNKLSCWQI
jgi:hypothetical protein